MNDRINHRNPNERKSEVLCPEDHPYTDNAYRIFNDKSNSAGLKFRFDSSYSSTQLTTIRDETDSEEYNRLAAPILADRGYINQHKGATDDQFSSFASSHLLDNKKNIFKCLKLAGKLISVATAVGFSAQTLCFVLLLIHVDHNHTQTYGIVLTVLVIGSLGVIFGLWSLLGNYMNSPKHTTRLAYVGGGCFVLHLLVALSFALSLSEQKLIESTGDLDDAFFQYNILCIFLAFILVIELSAVIIILRMASEGKKLNDLENVQQKKSEILSQMAQDLVVS